VFSDAGKAKATSLILYPGRIIAISRWSSAANATGKRNADIPHPGGMQVRCVGLPAVFATLDRRLMAGKPPA